MVDKNFDWNKFHKELDSVLAEFIEEELTYESGKTMTDFNILEFGEWVNKRRKAKVEINENKKQEFTMYCPKCQARRNRDELMTDFDQYWHCPMCDNSIMKK